MKLPVLSIGKAGIRFTGLIFVSAIMGAGFIGAETYRHGDSTAIIQQSGGSEKSESQVIRYPDGQKIITRDGSSTDITIQQGDRFLPSDNSNEYPEIDVDCLDRWFSEKRFSEVAPDTRSDPHYSEGKPSSARDDFKQRMLDRMRGDR